jgi:arabinosaccharide transport system substrate-binding protein
MKSFLAGIVRTLSPGISLVLGLGIISSVIVAFLPLQPRGGMQIWLGDGNHANLYRALAPEWNRRHPDLPLTVSLISGPALQSRMLSGFYSGTPLPDLIEVERGQIGQVFAGPLQDVGFVDLTDLLARDGLADAIDPASFSPWTSRGRIFGLPRGAHPVVLVYRSDLVEGAGIDVKQIETWDDYFRLMHPLLKDMDGDGYINRYPLTISLTNASFSEIFLIQGGGGYFDGMGNPLLNSAANVRIVARLATWYAGPDRVIGDINMYTGAGLRLLREGYAIAIPSADWYVGNLPTTLPSLAGKIKVMPLPAWERGGRRTSANGGTMIGVTKASKHREVAWELAKFLYLSPVIARQLYELTHIVSPLKSTWSASYLDRPEPYFCGQPVGRILQQAIPDIPPRHSSPYLSSAVQLVNSVITQLMTITDREGYTRPEQATADAQRLLDEAQHTLLDQIHRNVFQRTPATP